VNTTVMLAIGLLADDAPRNTGPDFGKASPFGLIVVVLLLIGTFLLVWSMNRHLRKLPKSFDETEPEQVADEEPKSESGG
jgi:F0F1-type ATP synthase assembly protein I